MRRPIPPVVFRALGAGILVTALAVPGYWAWHGSGPVAWVAKMLPFGTGPSALMAALIVLIVSLIAALVPILALRQFTAGMPTMRDEEEMLGRMMAGDRRDVDALSRSPGFAHTMGIALVAVGIPLLGLSVVVFTDAGVVYHRLIGTGVILCIVGSWMLLRGRVPPRPGEDQR